VVQLCYLCGWFPLNPDGQFSAIMRSWTGQGAWKDWSRRLAVANGDHFEREALVLLRFMWPEMTQAPRLRAWDRRGIDLFVWNEVGPFPIAVQCKGFEVQEIGQQQIAQIEDSIATFQQSDASAGTYLVVHNRDSRNPDLNSRVLPLLERLVATGKATHAEIWSRSDLVNKFFVAMEERVVDGLHVYSSQFLDRFSQLFDFGGIYVSPVPARQRSMIFRRDRPCQVSQPTPTTLIDVPGVIDQSGGTHWTLLTGNFGFGKTTSATRAAAANRRPVLLVPAATVPAQVFKEGNTNGLCQHVVESLAIIDDPDTWSETRRAAGAVLSYLLRHKDSEFVFILDGLDEHHLFATLHGLQGLSNQLAEFACAVILTTRKEHLDVLLGDFNVAFAGLGARWGRERSVDTLELQPWTPTQSLALIDEAIGMAPPHSAGHLARLRDQLHDGTSDGVYGDLLTHPLFLHFILEDVAADGIRSVSRGSLLRSWIERKVRRDRSVWAAGTVETRPTVDPELDTETFIARLMRVLESVAFSMANRVNDTVELLESITEAEVIRLLRAEFPGSSAGLLPLLLNSVLTVHSRTAGSINVGFALRTLQEYLTASYLMHHEIPFDGWPSSVRSFQGD